MVLRRTRLVAGVSVVVAGLLASLLVYRMNTWRDPWATTVEEAGYQPATATVNDIELSYVEGPDNGPPLVLLHAQHMDWFSYSRVMPALAQSFHVFVIDYPGHGATRTPDDYPMTAQQIGSDLADFVQSRIGSKVFVSGNSSGGLLATWLAAYRPDLVEAVVLEDPPLFSSEAGRIAGTIADRSFATSEKAVQEGTDDFLLYWIAHSRAFFDKNVFKGSSTLLTQAIRIFRSANPGEPLELNFLKNDTVRLFLRGMDQYDPRFGAAFHDGTWNEGFDHDEALSRIQARTLLLQADTRFLDDGTLNGAMTRQDAERAATLLPHGSLRRIDSEHVVHLDQPQQFVLLLERFFLVD